MKNRRILMSVLSLVFALCGVFAFVACSGDDTDSDDTDSNGEPEKYTVTYVAGENGTGTAPQGGSYAEGETFTVAENTFTCDGYTFAGWSDGENTVAAGTTYTMPASDVTFTAHWVYVEKTFTVSFETNGAGEIESKQWTEGTALEVTAPTKARNEFKGWFYDEEFTRAADLANLTAEGDFTLYAQWEYIFQTYTVTFVTNGAGEIESKTWTEHGALELTPPTRTGYTFVGWFFDSEFANRANQSYLEIQDAEVTSLTLYAQWEANEYKVYLYSNGEDGDPVIHTYKMDETVNVSDWTVPECVHEGQKVDFLYWESETGHKQFVPDATFTMGAESLSLYPVYDMPQLFAFDYDPETDTYTSTRAGIRPITNMSAEAPFYGEISVDFVVNDTGLIGGTTTSGGINGVGIFWNATIPETDYPYNGAGTSYFYMHMNPRNGGFQLALVNGDLAGSDSYETLSPNPSKTTNWTTKWNEWNTARAAEATFYPLEFNFKAVFTPTSIMLYVDGELNCTYTGIRLNSLTGGYAGIRAAGAGVTAKNIVVSESTAYPNSAVHKISFVTDNGETIGDYLYAENVNLLDILPKLYGGYDYTWYIDADCTNPVTEDTHVTQDVIFYGKSEEVTLQNGFAVYEDKYVVNAATGVVITTVPGAVGQYGQWSADFTVTANTGRIGLFFNATVPTSESSIVWTNTAVDGYSMYINVGAIKDSTMAYFTFGHIKNGSYGATTSDSASFGSYTFASANAGSAEYQKFYNDIWSMKNGEQESVTFTMTITVTETRVVFSLNGHAMFVKANPNATLNHEGTGWGFYAEKEGSISNWKYDPDVTEQNGFIITKDAEGNPVYTSAPTTGTSSIAVQVANMGDKFGLFETDIEIDNISNGRTGLVIKGEIPDSEDGSDLIWNNTSIHGYFLYHNVKANANFTLASIMDGTYTTGGTAKAYAGTNATAPNDTASDILKEYWYRNHDMVAGTALTLTFKLGFEVKSTGEINVYVDGELYFTNTSYYNSTVGEKELSYNEDLTGVGFVAYGVGTVFSNIRFTPEDV